MTGPENMVGPSNTRAWRAAGDGAATGSATAEGYARVYAALACGGELDGLRILRPETVATLPLQQKLAHAEGTANDGQGEFGLGYQLFWKMYPGMGTKAFGHTGMGGSIGFADPERRLGFGYVMNKLATDGATTTALLRATYRSFARMPS
jgi:CubicO group peptidase (beta-lactamase class C family)